MFDSKKNSDVNEEGLNACLSGEEIFQQPMLKIYLAEIKNLISCTHDIYQQLYLTTLHRLAEFCQSMPYSDSHFSGHFGLLERQLKLSIATLKIRRGLLLPKNAETETIAEEEAQWTYAIFTSALLRDVGQIENDRIVTLHHQNGELAGRWSPLSGSLWERNMFFQIKFEPSSTTGDKQIFMAAVSGRVIPAIGFRWLADNKRLFLLWWETLLHKNVLTSEIMEIIENAATKLQIKLGEDNKVKKQEGQLMCFIQYINDRIASSSHLVFRTAVGLFVSESVMDDFSSQQSISTNQLLEELQKVSALVLKESDYYHSLSPKQFEDRQLLRGVMIILDCLPDFLKTLPINDQYQETIKL